MAASSSSPKAWINSFSLLPRADVPVVVDGSCGPGVEAAAGALVDGCCICAGTNPSCLSSDQESSNVTSIQGEARSERENRRLHVGSTYAVAGHSLLPESGNRPW